MIIDEKIKLRKIMSILRENISPEQKNLEVKLIIENFLKYFPLLKSHIIAGFNAIKNEPNLEPLYFKLAAKNILCFPSIVNKHLIFRRCDKGHEFIVNKKYKTLEPNPLATEVIPDLLLVPMLAADEKGNRLGFGGGFYDQYLQHLTKKIISVGICFEFQIVKEVPVEEKDQKLDFIITNQRVIKARNSYKSA